MNEKTIQFLRDIHNTLAKSMTASDDDFSDVGAMAELPGKIREHIAEMEKSPWRYFAWAPNDGTRFIALRDYDCDNTVCFECSFDVEEGEWYDHAAEEYIASFLAWMPKPEWKGVATPPIPD